MPSWTPRPSRIILFVLVLGATCTYFLILSPESLSDVLTAPILRDDSVPMKSDSSSKKVAGRGADVEKRDAVVAAFKHAWDAYERDAMGADEYHPLSHRGENLSHSSPKNGIGYTIADALDTMYLMGPSLTPSYQRARAWVANSMSFAQTGEFSTFETTIRVLGGLLAIYHLTQDEIYRVKAQDLGERLLGAFDTKSGLPYPSVDLATKKGMPDRWSPNRASTAEATTVQLEFRYLAEITGREKFWRKAENAMQVAKEHVPVNGRYVVPIYMDLTDGGFTGGEVRLGSRGDSYYEYLLKQFLQTNNTEPAFKEMYAQAMDSVHEHLVKQTPKRKLTYIAELYSHIVGQGKIDWTLSSKQDHLVCFFAGSLMLGATTTGLRPGVSSASIPPNLQKELTEEGRRDWKTGKELMETCMKTHETKTGLSPEIAQFGTENSDNSQREWWIKRLHGSSYDARYMLRPETVESLFIAYRLTHDVKYRDYAWQIFSAIEKHCKIPGGGYATVEDVDQIPVKWDDKQETFFLSETLKYLFLTFEDESTMSLKDYVFNTEGHPLPIFSPTITPRFS